MKAVKLPCLAHRFPCSQFFTKIEAKGRWQSLGCRLRQIVVAASVATISGTVSKTLKSITSEHRPSK